jgi:hypothetical protein
VALILLDGDVEESVVDFLFSKRVKNKAVYVMASNIVSMSKY